MFIKLSDDQNAPVALTITIDGIYYWNYSYNCDNRINNSDKLNKPKTHVLGIVSSLRGDVNWWEIELWNNKNEEIEVKVKLEWTGGVIEPTTWVNGTINVRVPSNSRNRIKGAIKFI